MQLHPPTQSIQPCQGTKLQLGVCKLTHYCSLRSKAGIHNSRWFSIFAPLWTRCWCPRLSGRTWGPLWWPRPPPGTWAVWAVGWCPKAFWGSRRETCASRWEERTRGGGVIRQSKSAWQRQRGACKPCVWLDETGVLLGSNRESQSCVFPQRRAWRAPAASLLYSTEFFILQWPHLRNSVRDTEPKWLTRQLLYTMHCATPIKGI